MDSTKQKLLNSGEFKHSGLSWECFRGKKNDVGQDVYACCSELNILTGPCSSLHAAIHSLWIRIDITLRKLGYSPANFRVEMLGGE